MNLMNMLMPQRPQSDPYSQPGFKPNMGVAGGGRTPAVGRYPGMGMQGQNTGGWSPPVGGPRRQPQIGFNGQNQSAYELAPNQWRITQGQQPNITASSPQKQQPQNTATDPYQGPITPSPLPQNPTYAPRPTPTNQANTGGSYPTQQNAEVYNPTGQRQPQGPQMPNQRTSRSQLETMGFTPEQIAQFAEIWAGGPVQQAPQFQGWGTRPMIGPNSMPSPIGNNRTYNEYNRGGF